MEFTMKIAANYCVYNEQDYIEYSLKSIYPFVDKIIILISDAPWKGIFQAPDRTLEIVEVFPDPDRKIYFESGFWENQAIQRNHALNLSRKFGMDYCWVIDGDEIYEEETVSKLKKALKGYPNGISFYCAWWTYWRSFYYRIDPPETSTFVIGKITKSFHFMNARQPSPGKVVGLSKVFLHHYSYARPLERIKKKMTNIQGPGGDIRYDWFEKFKTWPNNKTMRDLHPFWQNHYQRAIRIDRKIPVVLKNHPWAKLEVIP